MLRASSRLLRSKLGLRTQWQRNLQVWNVVQRPLSVEASTQAVDPLGLDGVIVTKRCADRIDRLNSERDTPRYLRLAVDSGGCSGFQYSFEVRKVHARDASSFQILTCVLVF